MPPNNLHYDLTLECLQAKSQAFLFCPKPSYKQASLIFGDIILMNTETNVKKKKKGPIRECKSCIQQNIFLYLLTNSDLVTVQMQTPLLSNNLKLSLHQDIFTLQS